MDAIVTVETVVDGAYVYLKANLNRDFNSKPEPLRV